MCKIFRFSYDGDTYHNYSQNLLLKLKPKIQYDYMVTDTQEKIVVYRPPLTKVKMNLYTLVYLYTVDQR